MACCVSTFIQWRIWIVILDFFIMNTNRIFPISGYDLTIAFTLQLVNAKIKQQMDSDVRMISASYLCSFSSKISGL
jgi:hypothetical protein